MEEVKVIIPSRLPHCSQIITGFYKLSSRSKSSYKINFVDISKEPANTYRETACVFVEYRGKLLIYDTYDGYNAVNQTLPLVEQCDYYFKRSFSYAYNQKYFSGHEYKIFPLGFNYHVTYFGNPIDQKMTGLWSMLYSIARYSFRSLTSSNYTPSIFERGQKNLRLNHNPKIIFLTRLWDPDCPEILGEVSSELTRERVEINEMRIQIIRGLKKRYGNQFIGGLFDEQTARNLAPDLIVDDCFSERSRYLRIMQDCDICIGSIGLHESIGWKTGEYIASAKAIVNERLHYCVPGNFMEGKNYLSFSTAEECFQAVQCLMTSPELVLSMKLANKEYYSNYLVPDKLIENTLEIIKEQIKSELIP